MQVKAQEDRLGNQFNFGSASRPMDRTTSFANIYDRFQSNVMDEREHHEFFRDSSHLVQRPTLHRPEPGRGIYSYEHDAERNRKKDNPNLTGTADVSGSLFLMSHPHSWPGSCTTPSQKNLIHNLRGTGQQGNHNVHFVDFLSSPQSRLNDMPGDGIKLDLTMSTGTASSEPLEDQEIKISERSVDLDLTLDLTMSTS